MREIIEEILGTEKGAQDLVEQARAQAQALKSAVDAEVAQLLTRSREEAQVILQDEAQRAREQVRAAHGVALRTAEEENARFLARQEATLGRLVDDVTTLILAPEHARI